MKYIKTFEKQITIKIDDDAQENLLIFAVKNKDINLIKTLLKKGVNPDININGGPIIFHILSEMKPNLEIIKMFLDAGASLIFNDDQYTKHLFHTVFNTNNKNYLKKTENYIKILPLLIKAGAKLNLENKPNVVRNTFPTSFDNFFDMVDAAIDWHLITDETRNRIFDIIKKESRKDFDIYMTNIAARKYNI